MAAAAKSYDAENSHLVKMLFLPAIQELTKLKDTKWFLNFYYRPECNEILSVLDDKEIDIVLGNLIFLEKIDFDAEEILIPIAKKFPEKVLRFFGTRLTVKNEDGKQASTFDSIPFNFHRLSKSLSASPELVVGTVCDWYDGNYTSFIFGGARLVSNIFTSLTDELEHELIALVNTGQEKNLRIVMAILHNYKGNPSVNNLCEEIVKILPGDSNLLSKVKIILRNTGVLKGEFGLVTSLNQKKQDISNWLEKSDEKIKCFAKEYISELDNEIIFEKRRVEERIMLQKHQFGDDDSADNGKDA